MTAWTARGRLRKALQGLVCSALVSTSLLGLPVPLNPLAKAAFAPAAARSALPLAVGHPAPPLALTDLAGQLVTLNAYQGRPLILNFWATWCAPCREEMPILQQAHDAHRHAGLEVRGQ